MEIWKSIPSFPMYDASSDGRVRNAITKKVVSPRVGARGYLHLNVYSGASRGLAEVQGRFTRSVHRLVCEAFHGPCPPAHQAAHRDGDRANNRAMNLRWATVSQNHLDKNQHGTMTRRPGETHPLAKLKEGQVLEIIRKSRAGASSTALAAEFGISRRQVSFIASGKRWAHLRQPR